MPFAVLGSLMRKKKRKGGLEASNQGHRSPEHEQWNLLWAGA